MAHTEETNPVNQVGRNITLIRALVRDFIASVNVSSNKDFFLYVAFHDPHRCGHTDPRLGAFCERFGDGVTPGAGSIPDWRPEYYRPADVVVPSHAPDTPATREEIAAQYMTTSRLDQGVGLVVAEVPSDTLIIYTSDNGIPFPNGRTNVYDSGVREPFLIASPATKGTSSDALVSLLDITPTVLDWFNVSYPDYHLLQKDQPTTLLGRSLLPLLDGGDDTSDDIVFGSHGLHEVTMYYPMRYARTARHKLIHNLNAAAAFPIDQDFYISASFQVIGEGVHAPF